MADKLDSTTHLHPSLAFKKSGHPTLCHLRGNPLLGYSCRHFAPAGPSLEALGAQNKSAPPIRVLATCIVCKVYFLFSSYCNRLLQFICISVFISYITLQRLSRIESKLDVWVWVYEKNLYLNYSSGFFVIW